MRAAGVGPRRHCKRCLTRVNERGNYNICVMRVLGVDVGERRVGLAISDPSRTLARPLATLTVQSAEDAIARVAGEVTRLLREDEGLGEVVVGLPKRLDGSPSDATARVTAF